ncbi:hypothetical protein CYMTET_33226 [Cymbomonas tetramitiformis]|uniref:Inositol polyphosphate-related phosphatase domain-containing protein n=1 Tax=Cymbomonas tetramitiformis TaxID=36881 RepID=A0AAE0FE32_9CHLO|nr:hypothetical protein CYMTET_33226 [Cymbomonas tetramitiformis]
MCPAALPTASVRPTAMDVPGSLVVGRIRGNLTAIDARSAISASAAPYSLERCPQRYQRIRAPTGRRHAARSVTNGILSVISSIRAPTARDVPRNVISGIRVGGVLYNKGGVAVAMKIADTRVCFVNAHLAAHQEMYEERNSHFRKIIHGLKLGHREMDISCQFDHLIFLGDLNYRYQR